MYQFFNSTSSHLRTNFRDDILSLLGNSGKTLYTPVPVENSFSLGFFFSDSLQKIYTRVKNLPYLKPIAYIVITLATLSLAPAETSFAATE